MMMTIEKQPSNHYWKHVVDISLPDNRVLGRLGFEINKHKIVPPGGMAHDDAIDHWYSIDLSDRTGRRNVTTLRIPRVLRNIKSWLRR